MGVDTLGVDSLGVENVPRTCTYFGMHKTIKLTDLITVVFYKTAESNAKSLVLADTPIHTINSPWRNVFVDLFLLRPWRSRSSHV